VGDAPVSYGRWRLHQNNEGMTTAIADRLCVRAEYRGRGIAKATLERIAQVERRRGIYIYVSL
jgi:GNAT superfamily N-acetyltransferase